MDEVVPPVPEVTVKVYVISSKFAVTEVFPLIVILKEVFVPVALPLQPVKVYPSSGVAVTVTEDPSSYSPPVVETEPPFPAVTESVKLGVGGA